MASQTTFNDALSKLETRYDDMGLARVDDNNVLKRRTRALHKKMERKKGNMQAKGCFVNKIDHDFSLNISKKCHIAETLAADANAVVGYFNGSKKCSRFRKSFQKFDDAYNNFFDGKEATCEVNLASQFGDHSTAIGRVQGDAIVFDGIKYGEHQRFMRSEAARPPMSNDMSSPSVSCPIASNVMTGKESLPRSTPEAEDCLYLKVTAPLSAFEDGAEAKKVITWIHGGTWNFGGMDVIYEDPTPLVGEQDLIVVKMNYRLGPFANWYFPFRPDGQPKTNFGLLDQRLAMKWVRDNVASFNGDDADITLAGASAGGAAVSIHTTHEDSWDYFDNTMIMSAIQIVYWPEQDASNGYGYIATELLKCTTAENFQADLISGAYLGCLQSIPLQQFQAIMSQAGDVFSKIALDAGRLTQLEGTFSPNFDGETLLEDPLKLIQQENYKDDLGFMVLEVTTHEATTMSSWIFGGDQMRDIMFGEHKPSLWPTEGPLANINAHVTLPLAAYQGFLGGLLPAAVVPSVLAAFPCAPNPAFGQAAPLLTECVDTAADFVNGYLFTCPIDYAAALGVYGKSVNSYAVLFAGAMPGPSPYNDDGKDFLMPYFPSFDKCYAALDNKSCHIEGAKWFFGEYIAQNLEVTDAEADFGKLYRQAYGDLIKNGSSNSLASAKTGAWNKFTVENEHEVMGRPMEQQCQVMNYMEQQAGFYGNFR